MQEKFEAVFAKKTFLEFVLYLSVILSGNVFVIHAVKLDDKDHIAIKYVYMYHS